MNADVLMVRLRLKSILRMATLHLATVTEESSNIMPCRVGLCSVEALQRDGVILVLTGLYRLQAHSY